MKNVYLTDEGVVMDKDSFIAYIRFKVNDYISTDDNTMIEYAYDPNFWGDCFLSAGDMKKIIDNILIDNQN